MNAYEYIRNNSSYNPNYSFEISAEKVKNNEKKYWNDIHKKITRLRKLEIKRMTEC